MSNKFWVIFTSLWFLATPAYSIAMPASVHQKSEFQRIEQPLWLKSSITFGGLTLISLEIWWFLLNKAKNSNLN